MASEDWQMGGSDVRAVGLTMTYKTGSEPIEALREVELEIPQGQLVCVLGPSGCGKTTLLNLIAGLLTPTSGRVFIGDTEVSKLSQDEASIFRRRNIGIVFQFFNLIPMLNLEENVALPLLLDGSYLQTLRSRIKPLLEQLGIADRREYSIDELSGGELQRAAIARALLAQPKLILADEPTGNLDSRTGDEVLSLLHKASREHNLTTILFTHNLRAVSFSDRVISLRDGRITEDLLSSRDSRSK